MNIRKDVLDHGFVELLVDELKNPSDLTVVNAARVSFGKESKSLTDGDKKLLSYLQKNNHWTPFAHPRLSFCLNISKEAFMTFVMNSMDCGFIYDWNNHYTVEKDSSIEINVSGSLYGWLTKGMRYLHSVAADSIADRLNDKFPECVKLFRPEGYRVYDNQDMVTWAFNDRKEKALPENVTPLSFRIKAPIPIRTQFFKHKMGFVENEISRRYVDFEPEIYNPENAGGFRGRPPKSMKQGSSDEIINITNLCSDAYNTGYHPYKYPTSFSVEGYKHLLEQGVAPEQARFVLPQGAYTEWWWSGTLESFARFYNLRKDPHAQWEIRQYAEAIAQCIREYLPNQKLI